MISNKFSTADISGVIGLAAFLADPDACMKRLQELVVEAEKEYTARSEAQALRNEIVDLSAKLEQLQKDANVATETANAVKAKAQAAREDAAARNAAVDEREQDLAEKLDAHEVAELVFAARVAEADEREAALDSREVEVSMAEIAHKEKVEKLRALTAD